MRRALSAALGVSLLFQSGVAYADSATCDSWNSAYGERLGVTGVGWAVNSAGGSIYGSFFAAERSARFEHWFKKGFDWLNKTNLYTAAEQAENEKFMAFLNNGKKVGRRTFWIGAALFFAGAYGLYDKYKERMRSCSADPTAYGGRVRAECYSENLGRGATELTAHLLAGLTLGESKASAGDLESYFLEDPSRLFTHPDRKIAQYYFLNSPKIHSATLALLEEYMGQDTQSCEPISSNNIKPGYSEAGPAQTSALEGLPASPALNQ